MSPSISTVIVTVSDRIAWAQQLAELTAGVISLDTAHRGAAYGHHAALTIGLTSDASHICILEDDAILCDRFTTRIAELVSLRPDHLIGLYVGAGDNQTVQRRIPTAITASRGPFLELATRQLHWAVGYLIPRIDIPNVLPSLETAPLHCRWADRLIGRWHGRNGRLSYAWPPLVDHRDAPSVNGTSLTTSRRAWSFAGVGEHPASA